MRCSRPLLVAAFLALALRVSSAEAACSAAPTANTTDGLLSFATNPPAYGQVSGIPVADGALVYDSTTKLFKYCDGTNWVTLGATGTAAGSTGYVQFNTSGSLDSDSNFYWEKISQRLGIGTTSPMARLDVNASSATYGTARIVDASASGTENQMRVLSSSDANYGLIIGKNNSAASTLGYHAADAAHIINYPNAPLFLGANNAPYLTILGSGNIGIGTTSPAQSLTVYGGDILVSRATGPTSLHLRNDGTNSYINNMNGFVSNGSLGNGFLVLTGQTGINFNYGSSGSQGTTAMAVNSSGNVGVGTTGPAEKLTVSTTANVDKLGIYNFGTGKGNGVVFQPFADDAKVFSFRNASATEVGSIVIKSASTLYNVASDRRLKENIADTARGLADLLRLGVKDFNFISDPKKERVQGFIAQDFYKVYPEAVQVGGDDPKEHPWQVDYGRLTPLLVKAVQELKADNDNLRRDLAAAERRLQALEQARR